MHISYFSLDKIYNTLNLVGKLIFYEIFSSVHFHKAFKLDF